MSYLEQFGTYQSPTEQDLDFAPKRRIGGASTPLATASASTPNVGGKSWAHCSLFITIQFIMGGWKFQKDPALTLPLGECLSTLPIGGPCLHQVYVKDAKTVVKDSYCLQQHAVSAWRLKGKNSLFISCLFCAV